MPGKIYKNRPEEYDNIKWNSLSARMLKIN